MSYEYEKMANSIKYNLLDYIKVKTHTNTKKENNNVDFFERWFKSKDYFKQNPHLWGLYPIEKDHLKRKVPWGLVKGNGDKTIVFIHHSDTVDVLDYGAIKDLAYDPIKLEKALSMGKLDINQEVKKDLESGEWLFGRGVADMKGGGAIQLSLIEKYSLHKEFKGNLLILALPDEENLSAGMRSAAYLLKELEDRYNLDYQLMLNCEPHERKNATNPVIYEGSIGKIMPIFYVRGKLSHVGQIYDGFNPILLLTEIVRKTELNTKLIDVVNDEATPSPTWLYLKDRKNVYDVSLPVSAGGYMSILTFKSSPKCIVKELEGICREAFSDTIEHMNNSYKFYTDATNQKYEKLPWEVNVKSFETLFNDAKKDSGQEFINAYEATMKVIKVKIEEGSLDIAEASYILIEKTFEYVHDLSPTVIIALAPPYYPHVSNDMIKDLTLPVKDIVDELINFAHEEWKQQYETRKFYTGISDLSYAMYPENEEAIEYIKHNMMMWEGIYNIPLEVIKELSIPVLNIGPWGKDFHKNTERVYKEDLYYRTPRLIEKVIKKIL